MENGHAESAPESTLEDLSSFLDTPEEESNEETELDNTAEESTSEADTDDDADSEQTDEGDEPEETAPAEEQKITVKIKNEDGTEESVEFTPDELPKAILRQRDYTRKTQALAQRENEAVQFLAQKHEEIRSQYVTQAEVNRAAIVSMAGIKSEAEMAQLAHSDPAAWVAEQQRQRQIGAYLSELDAKIQSEKTAAQQQAEQRNQMALKQQYQKTWEVLEQQKIDKPKLADIYSKVKTAYGLSDAELGNVYDHRLVLMMKDAAAYRELQAKRTEVTKKADAAPRMPSKQQPAQKRLDQALEQKFKGGRAKLNDLAALLR